MRYAGYGVGAIGAGLFFMFKEGLPLLKAWRSGVIRTRGYRRQDVRRDIEPERFKKLFDQRLRLACLGVLLFVGGSICTAYVVYSIVTAPIAQDFALPPVQT